MSECLMVALQCVSKLAPIMKKPGAGSTGKSGLGSIGKSGLSSGKSGMSSSAKSGSMLGSSGKTGLGSTSKNLGSTPKSNSNPTSKPSGLIAKSSSPKPSKSFDFMPSDKTKSLVPSSPKSYPSSSSYNVYGTPKSGKSATFGIIWIPTGKRNKMKKDIVLNSHNDDRRRDRSPSFYKFMSGDTHDQPHKKEETDLLVVPDRKIAPGVIAATETAIAGNVAASDLNDKQNLLRHDEESKEAAGDSKDNDTTDDDKDYLSNDEPVRHKLPDTLTDKVAYGDKVDSVYLRPPPPHKARSTASTQEEDSCGIKCLYYTLQCCDCVLM